MGLATLVGCAASKEALAQGSHQPGGAVMNTNEASSYRRTTALIVIAAFAAGAGFAVATSSWRTSSELAPARVTDAPAIIDQASTVTHAAPAVSTAPAVPERDSRAAGTPMPNPFQRVERRVTPDTRGKEQALATTSAVYTSYQASPEYAPTVTRDWVRRFRSSCARYVDSEKVECERIAERIERILEQTKGVDERWVSAMQEELQLLFSASIRAKDFSLREVTCNANGCILYWHSSDYADWQAAGDVLVKDLLESSSFAEFDRRDYKRLGDFDPTTSIPWEMLVLDRKPVGSERLP
jgi:hypothetical protein